MSWLRAALATITGRVETDITSRLTGNAPLLRRSAFAILARVFSGAMHSQYGYQAYLADQILPDKAEGAFIDRWAFIRKLTRKAAAPATGTAIISGTNGVNIPSGTILVRDDGIEYITSNAPNISGGVATLNITCRTAGALGNLSNNEQLLLSSPIAGATDILNTTNVATGGSDIESDTYLRARVLFNIQNPSAGGNKTDYVQWATSVAGVFKAFCFPVARGAGTVDVVIIVSGTNPVAGSPLITSVQNYIQVPSTKEGVAPVAADVLVAPVVNRPVTITVSTKPNNSDTQAAIKVALAALFVNESVPDGKILISHIREAITSGGIQDNVITAITVNGSGVSIADIDLAGGTLYEYATFDPATGITFNTLT